MKTIPLSRGLVTIVDDEDFERLGHLKWYAGQAERAKRFYASRRFPGYVGTVRKLHRLIVGARPGEIVDHINGDSLDNRRSNLRICTARGNAMNRGKWRRPTSSQYKGVSWYRQNNKWGAYIGTKDGRKFLGLFTSEHDAARAYNEAAIKYFGNFARLNVIEEPSVDKESICQVA